MGFYIKIPYKISNHVSLENFVSHDFFKNLEELLCWVLTFKTASWAEERIIGGQIFNFFQSQPVCLLWCIRVKYGLCVCS